MDCESSHSDALHKEYPKNFARNEFWKQIKRTVNGEPIGEQQIQMIVDQVNDLLELHNQDWLLDLGCGNGALGNRFVDSINRYTGVDFSSYLLEIAEEFFQPGPFAEYIEADMRNTAGYLQHTNSFTKALIYGCASYVGRNEFNELIMQLTTYCPFLNRIMIGNLPDRDKAKQFYAIREITEYQVDEPGSPIGVWWSKDEVFALADRLDWACHIAQMPDSFCGSFYRFDVLLERRKAGVPG